MKRDFLYVVALFAGLISGQAVYAQEPSKLVVDDLGRPYIKVGAGVMACDAFKASGYSGKKPNLGPIFNLGIGHRITESLRSDLDIQYGEVLYKANKGEQRSNMIGVLAVGHYDLVKISQTTTPYVALGAGFSRNHAGTLVDNAGPQRKVYPGKTKTDFAWNVGVGVKFNIDKDYTLDLGYRYSDLGKIKVGDHIDENNRVSRGGSQKIKGHQGLLALLYKF